MSTSIDLFPDSKVRRVISASRRTDMVATDPAGLAALLHQKAPPSETHTVVLWTKNPRNILFHAELYSQLELYDQCYVHLTITGLGGSVLEPRVPVPHNILEYLPALIDFVESPERITVRFDPIVHFIKNDGTPLCNLPFFEILAPILERHGVRNVTTSWVQLYDKVLKRLSSHGIRVQELSSNDLNSESEWLRKIAKKHKLNVFGCCVPEWPRSACINGNLLNQLHPRGYVAPTSRASGQRLLCGCTKSWDIGWYTACLHGCLYCYGRPQIYNEAYL